MRSDGKAQLGLVVILSCALLVGAAAAQTKDLKSMWNVDPTLGGISFYQPHGKWSYLTLIGARALNPSVASQVQVGYYLPLSISQGAPAEDILSHEIRSKIMQSWKVGEIPMAFQLIGTKFYTVVGTAAAEKIGISDVDQLSAQTDMLASYGFLVPEGYDISYGLDADQQQKIKEMLKKYEAISWDPTPVNLTEETALKDPRAKIVLDALAGQIED